jgi:autotransporter-associated beta strand protein
VNQAISLNGRNNTVPAIENLSGTNTLAGNISINVGGSAYWFQSDAGQLNLAGNLSSVATGTRTITFLGNGHFSVPGSIQNGSATVGVVKTNSGGLVLAGAQTYTGPTLVSNGTLIVNGTLGPGALTIYSGATLSGTGVIAGPVAIQPGATLAPGADASSIGALTVNNSLALAGTTALALNKAGFTNDSIRGLSSVTYGGALIVSNVAGTLTAGDTFTLFQAGSYNGAFSSIVLPPLATGLAWRTDPLTNGAIAVMSTIPPQIIAISGLPDSNLQISGVGVVGVNYQLLAATDLVAPVNWLVVTNAAADGAGAFQLFDLMATNFPTRFYRISGP